MLSPAGEWNNPRKLEVLYLSRHNIFSLVLDLDSFLGSNILTSSGYHGVSSRWSVRHMKKMISDLHVRRIHISLQIAVSYGLVL